MGWANEEIESNARNCSDESNWVKELIPNLKRYSLKRIEHQIRLGRFLVEKANEMLTICVEYKNDKKC